MQVQFSFFLHGANLIGPLLKKPETMKAPQNKRSYFLKFRVEFLPFGLAIKVKGGQHLPKHMGYK
jgi:hypothetical protein